MTVRVLGVDGCRRGWAGIGWDGRVVTGVFASTLAELVDRARATGPIAVVGVDMPLGLADSGVRQADRLAQRALGRRASSIFVTPTRAALGAPDRAAASARNIALGGPGVTAQAYALRPKVLEVDDYVRSRPDPAPRLVEVHPELSFTALAGAPLAEPKRSWSGAAVRRRLLLDAGLDLGVDLGEVGRLADADDVVDAAAAAWSAMRVAVGEARCRPDPPERFSDGHDCAIWT
jgi:predicted RNase H-like nuclease